MEKFDINSLNDEQKEALFQTDGVVLVTAGAGSGKTRLLTHRICLLLEKGVSPYNILAITFTNKATNEMKNRIAQMTDKAIWISTFHSMCVRILRENIESLDGYTKNFTIIDENDKEKIVKELAKKYQCDEDELKTIMCHIDNIKNRGIAIADYFVEQQGSASNAQLKEYERICFEYEDYLKKNNSLDFDDLLNKTYRLFCDCPHVLAKYANRFEYILVDEFQDTNLVQYKLVKFLASVHKNLFVVGDEDQCIYSWRGANFKNIFDLQKDFENVHVFKLERNYRSTKNILTMANNVIANNKERLEKKLWTDKDNGDPPTIFEAFDEKDEAFFVSKTISDLLSQGYSYSDFAVLMRVNALSRSIEESFMSFRIPYKLYGGFKFYERQEIKIVLAYLSIFINQRDEISLLKVINFPKRGIGESAIENLENEAGETPLLEYLLSEKFAFSKYNNKLSRFVEKYKKLQEEMKILPLFDFVSKVVKSFGIEETFADKDEDKVENIESLISAVKEFQDDNENATLSDYLSNVMLKSDSDNIQENGFVSVATIHAVKGLEFPVVFVVGAEEGLFPLARASFSSSEMEEERRLMYVAVTRAEKKIYVSYAKKRYMYGKSTDQQKSRFLNEFGIVDKKKPRLFSFSNDEESEKKEKFDSGFVVGDRVFHARFGEGEILNISDDGLVADIDFDDFGKKSLMLNLAVLEKVK